MPSIRSKLTVSRPSGALLLAVAVLGAGVLVPGIGAEHRFGEFTFSDSEEHGETPNRFLNELLYEHAYPAQPTDAYVRTVAPARAFKAFQDVQFRGVGRGRKGTWHTVGPETVLDDLDPLHPDAALWKNLTGRVTALAIGNSCGNGKCRLWAGTAGGGLWVTDKALAANDAHWRHVALGDANNTIGSITLDPNDASGNTVYVGTGESNFTYSSGASGGLFRSADNGAHWQRLDTMITDTDVSPTPIDFTATRGIGKVAIKPGDANTIYVATTYAIQGMTAVRGGQTVVTGGPQAKVGLYRSTDGGQTWSLAWVPPVQSDFVSSPTAVAPGTAEVIEGVKDVEFDPLDPGTVYVSAFQNAIYRSSPALDGDATFRPVFALTGYDGIAALAAFALTVKDGHTRIYAGNGVDDYDQQALFRLDNADVAADQLVPNALPLANSAAWVRLTSSDASQPSAASYAYCNGQCNYDQVLAVPDGSPDTLAVGGQLNWWTGDAVIRTTDAGATFNGSSYDLQHPTGQAHVDVHAIVFQPGNPDVVFIGSDGGIARTSGQFGDGSDLCENPDILGYVPDTIYDALCRQMLSNIPTELTFLNKGLQAIQFFNVAADPNDPFGRIMAGAQDNSTLLYDAANGTSQKVWTTTFGFGDGTSANGFHPTDPDILFASYQSKYFFTQFHRGVGGTTSWTLTSGPILIAPGERSGGSQLWSGRQFMSFDPVNPDSQFTGYAHVWRTTDNGGDQAFLEAYCTVEQVFYQGSYPYYCGDWEPLGPKLNDSGYGDREGGLIVAAVRGAGDAGTLWVATNLGRVFVSHNADDPTPANVTFDRVDSTSGGTAPGRFISGIAVDPADSNHAWIAYSGFNALTPGSPGHVFEVTWDPNAGTSAWTSLDYDLGDLPINHLVRDTRNGDLYAATDFGVIRLPGGASHWLLAGTGLPPVLTPFLQILPDKKLLFAGTHGLGAWYLPLQ